jgi:ABC-type glutathione transport system ATPase component
VLVSHDLTAMAELCDRCVWIEHGRVNAIGAPEDVLARYAEAMHATGDGAHLPLHRRPRIRGHNVSHCQAHDL